MQKLNQRLCRLYPSELLANANVDRLIFISVSLKRLPKSHIDSNAEYSFRDSPLRFIARAASPAVKESSTGATNGILSNPLFSRLLQPDFFCSVSNTTRLIPDENVRKEITPQPPALPSPARTENLRLLMMTDEPGVMDSPAYLNTIVLIHVGSPSEIACNRRDERHRGTAIHGDIDVIPSGTPSRWELKDRDTDLIFSLSTKLMNAVAEDFEVDPCRVDIRNRFQVRDAQIEHIGWAAKAEMERGYPCGRLYLDSLGTALAAQLVRNYNTLGRHMGRLNAGLSGQKLKQVLSFIEDNLGDSLSLTSIAVVAGLSVSHCKVLFRQRMGMPLHQYVIRRRIERAAVLLRENKLSISQIALETGFSHQSHLAMHMRRVLGVSPKNFKSNFQ